MNKYSLSIIILLIQIILSLLSFVFFGSLTRLFFIFSFAVFCYSYLRLYSSKGELSFAFLLFHSLIISVCYSAWLYLYYALIDVDFFIIQRKLFIEKYGEMLPDKQLTEFMQTFDKFNSIDLSISLTLVINVVLGLLFSFVIILLRKEKEDVFYSN